MARDERVEEIERIDGQAFAMAQKVACDPSQRAALSAEAETLKSRLLTLAHELRDADPGAFEPVRHRVSEAQLDLAHVIRDTGFLSLRLGDLIR